MLNEEQVEILHKLLDFVSDTAAAEMITAYKAGFKGGVSLTCEVSKYYDSNVYVLT
jgi:hypothetical protein